MKNSLLLLIIFLSTAPGFSQAPVITQADIAHEGDEFIITNANPLILNDPEETGEDHTWDFSSLSPIAADTSLWLDETDTDPLYFFLWLSSDIAEQTTSDITTDFFTVEDVYNFYTSNSGEFAWAGFGGIISGIPLPIAFDDNDVIYEFPLTYNDTYSSVAGFDIDIPGIAAWSEQRSRSSVADGWGTLITPYGTFDALRVKSIIDIVDTIVYDAIEIPFAYTTTEYKWLTEGGGIPALQINSQNILGTETITQVIYRGEQISDAVEQAELSNGSVLILGNITTDNLVIELNYSGFQELSAAVIGMNGEIYSVFNHLSSGVHTLDLPQHLSAGLYMLVLKSEGNILSVNKFIKQTNEN